MTNMVLVTEVTKVNISLDLNYLLYKLLLTFALTYIPLILIRDKTNVSTAFLLVQVVRGDIGVRVWGM